MHLAAFYESIATGALTQVDAVQDDILTIQSNKFLLLDDWDLIFAQAGGTDIQRGRLVAPTFNKIGNPYIRPIRDVALTYDLPPVANYKSSPFRLPNRENIGFEAEHDNAGAQVQFGLIGLAKSIVPAPGGQVYTIRGTSTTAATAGAWSSLSTTWDNDLEGGFYNVVGGVVVGAAGIAFRLISQYSIERPGGLMTVDTNLPTHPLFRTGQLGRWIEFESDSLPTIQVLCTAATASFTIYLDIVKVR